MRPLTVKIHLDHLADNYSYLKNIHRNKMLAVIKADAYGHGAVDCARKLAQADGFAVAFLEEAVALRHAGITQPIVLLEGLFAQDDYPLCDRLNISPVIHQESQLMQFINFPWKNKITVWLKCDSGMHRVGFHPSDFAQACRALRRLPQVENVIAITHFAQADMDSALTAKQIQVFDDACTGLNIAQSAANSAGILAHPNTHRDWGRAGIALYGISPFEKIDEHLKPVMTLQSEVFAVRHLAAGESLGYGGIFTAKSPMRVGLVACGYADGYPRVPSNDNPVLIDGQKSRIVGRVSMDMLTVELLDDAHTVGSQVELWGSHISVAEIARRAGTISYELLCHIKRARRLIEGT